MDKIRSNPKSEITAIAHFLLSFSSLKIYLTKYAFPHPHLPVSNRAPVVSLHFI